MICGVRFPTTVVPRLFAYYYSDEPSRFVFKVRYDSIQETHDGKVIEIWRPDRRRILIYEAVSALHEDDGVRVTATLGTMVAPGNGIRFFFDTLEEEP